MAKSHSGINSFENLDGWLNTMTRVGDINSDKSVNARPVFKRSVQKNLEILYSADDMARKIVDRIPSDGMRMGIELQNLDKEIENKTEELLKSLQVNEKFLNAWQFSRLYGGAGLFVNFGERVDGDSKQILATELNKNTITEVRSLTLFNRFELETNDTAVVDITSPQFGLPKMYRLQPQSTGSNTFTIDQSRIIRFEGLELPTELFRENDFWHDSVLNKTFNPISKYNQVNDSVAIILLDLRVAIVKMDNLNQKIAGGEEGRKTITDKLQLIKLQKSVMSLIGIDKDDEFDYKTHNVGGIDKLVDKAIQRLVASSDMPHTILLGESPSGLSATGQSEFRDYYDFVFQEQERVLRPAYNQLFEYIFLSKQGPTKGKIPEGFSFKFVPLWQMNDVDRSKMELDVAKKDQIYIDMNVLTEAEVALSRYGGDEFSQETMLSPEKLEQFKNEQDNFRESDNNIILQSNSQEDEKPSKGLLSKLKDTFRKDKEK